MSPSPAAAPGQCSTGPAAVNGENATDAAAAAKPARLRAVRQAKVPWQAVRPGGTGIAGNESCPHTARVLRGATPGRVATPTAAGHFTRPVAARLGALASVLLLKTGAKTGPDDEEGSRLSPCARLPLTRPTPATHERASMRTGPVRPSPRGAAPAAARLWSTSSRQGGRVPAQTGRRTTRGQRPQREGGGGAATSGVMISGLLGAARAAAAACAAAAQSEGLYDPWPAVYYCACTAEYLPRAGRRTARKTGKMAVDPCPGGGVGAQKAAQACELAPCCFSAWATGCPATLRTREQQHMLPRSLQPGVGGTLCPLSTPKISARAENASGTGGEG